jgi:phenylacetate-CoA ligase
MDDLAPHYQVVVDRSQAFPTIEIHVEPAERLVREWGGFDTARAEVSALSARAAERLRAHLGLNPHVAIVPPKTIPRSEGKAVRVVERN